MKTLLLSIYLSTLLFATSGYAKTILGFRWGDADDDGKLLSLSEHLNPRDYRLNEADLLDAMNFLKSQGWSKRNSGAGIYFSSDVADSFGDGRKELFIFEISDEIPIATGDLGSTVHDHYVKHGPTPPMISRYTETWHVITRAPTDDEFKQGKSIIFHRATAEDAPGILEHFKTLYAQNPEKLRKTLATFAQRANDQDEYGKQIPPDTRKFIRGFTEKAVAEFSASPGFTDSSPYSDGKPSPSSRENALNTLSSLRQIECDRILSQKH